MNKIKISRKCLNTANRDPKEDYLIQNGYLFKGAKLSVPMCGTRERLIREPNYGYFWPGMSKEV